MSFWSGIGLAARALLAHRFRAALTLLSVFIGALAIVLMSSLAQSGFATIKRSIEEVGGARLILIVPKEPERARAKAQAYRTGVTQDDVERSLAGVPHVLDATRLASLRTHDVTAADGTSAQADLVGGDRRFIEALHFRIGAGRGFEEREHREHARVCVVGHPVAVALGQAPPALLGRQVSIDGLRCRVVGVLAHQPRFGFGMGFDWEKLVVISLLVSGINVMNVMLVSVSERTVEIGIRRAVGAPPRAIGGQFAFEALLLTGAGGLIGVSLGAALAALAAFVLRRALGGWELIIQPWAMLGGVAVSLFIGLVFGTYPARRAARLDIVRALRNE